MIEPGIYPFLSNKEYHADTAISRTAIMRFIDSPYKYFSDYIYSECPAKKETDSMRFGSAFHCYILEPEKFSNLYAHVPEKLLLRDIGREAYEEQKEKLENIQQSGKILLSSDEMNTLVLMRNAILANNEASAFLQDAYYENSFFWQDEHSGLMIKARPDILRHNAIIDLKTCASADSRYFQRQMAEQGYHIQGAMVREGIRQLTGSGIDTVINICIEKTYPYAIGIKVIKESALETGHMKFKQALLDMKACIERNEWKSYEPEEVELPSWAI